MKLLLALIAVLPLSAFSQGPQFVRVQNSQIEAFETTDGGYTRVEDIQDGFVSIDGVQALKDSISVEVNSAALSSIILQDGTRLNKAALNQAAAVIGGDMGGGGTAN